MHALEEHACSIEGLHNLNELSGFFDSPKRRIHLLADPQHLVIYIYNLPEHITILSLLIIYSLTKPCHLFFDCIHLLVIDILLSLHRTYNLLHFDTVIGGA